MPENTDSLTDRDVLADADTGPDLRVVEKVEIQRGPASVADSHAPPRTGVVTNAGDSAGECGQNFRTRVAAIDPIQIDCPVLIAVMVRRIAEV